MIWLLVFKYLPISMLAFMLILYKGLISIMAWFSPRFWAARYLCAIALLGFLIDLGLISQMD